MPNNLTFEAVECLMADFDYPQNSFLIRSKKLLVICNWESVKSIFNGSDGVNGTSSLPSSVLRYVVD